MVHYPRQSLSLWPSVCDGEEMGPSLGRRRGMWACFAAAPPASLGSPSGSPWGRGWERGCIRVPGLLQQNTINWVA